MDRNGKKPKATHDDVPNPERSDTKAHIRDEMEQHDGEARVAIEQADAAELNAIANQGPKGPQHL